MKPNRLFPAALAIVAGALTVVAAPPARQMPNVLFIAVDDLRPELGCYGKDYIRSPNIDRLADAGMVFDRAYCQQAVCSPSRTSLLTGMRPDTTKVYDLVTHFRKTQPDVVTLLQHFKSHGYFVQGMGKIFHGGLDDQASWSVPWQTPKAPRYALPENLALDRRQYEGEPDGDPAGRARRSTAPGRRGPAFEGADVPDNTFQDGKVAELAVSTLRDLSKQREPFFLAVGFIKPHLPFVSPKKYWDLYDPETIQLAPNKFYPKGAPDYAIRTGATEVKSYHGIPSAGSIPDDLARRLKHGYYAALSYTDAQVGMVLDELDRLGLRDNTIVILWGDHGWKLGEHDAWAKHSNCENDTHAPLILSVPGMKTAGTHSDALVEFVDIYPTLSELAGLPLPGHLEGTSFTRLLENPSRPWKSAAFSQYPRSQKGGLMGYAMRTERYRFIVWVSTTDPARVDAIELYDHQADPQENTNIAQANPELAAQLMTQWQKGWPGAKPPPQTEAGHPARPPNILFAIADDWGLHAGAYGTGWVSTPSFDRVADAGILFSNAYTPNAKCAPSRACILTGRNSWQLKAAANHWCYFPPEFKGWGEVLAEQGWFVGYTTKGWAPGVAKDANGNPRRLTGIAFNKKTAAPPAAGIGNADYAANFDDFLDAAPADQPWAFWYGAIEPHRGYEFGSGVAKGGKRIADVGRVPAFWPDNDVVRNDILDYAFEVEHFDSHLGRMLASLETRGILDNTLVVVTSDHGMPFPRVKGNAYEFANHVPLAAMWKNGIAGHHRRVDDYVSFIDLAPTFVELAGLTWQQTGMAPSPGRSLTPLFRTDQSGIVDPSRDHVLIGKERHDVGRPHDQGYPIRGIVKNSWLYLENLKPDRWPSGNPETGYLNVDGGATKSFILAARRMDPADKFWAVCFGKRPAEELYNLGSDIDCVRNLADTDALAGQREALKSQLETELKEQDDPRMFGGGDVFDDYPYADPSGVNFYERFLRGEKLNSGWVSRSDFEKAPLD